MLLHRVVPYLPTAKRGEPGHPLYIHPRQGAGRWDNPVLYRALYTAATPSAAIGETFAHLRVWSTEMLTFPALPGATRTLAVCSIDEETHPLLDLDDARALLDRSLRPSEVVLRNRPHTQRIAAEIHGEGRWAGIAWWSIHRPQWTVHCWWDHSDVVLHALEPIAGHPGTLDAANVLAKDRRDV